MTPKTSLSAASGKHQNILAPASLVCGLLAWTLLTIVAALAAILTGHIAYAKNKRLKVGGKGMALTGLVLGYSGLGTAMMLIGIWAGGITGGSGLTFFAGTAEAAWFSELRGCGAAGLA